MLCIIGNMPTYVTNLHRLAGNLIREWTRSYANDFFSTYRGDREEIIVSPRIAGICQYLKLKVGN